MILFSKVTLARDKEYGGRYAHEVQGHVSFWFLVLKMLMCIPNRPRGTARKGVGSYQKAKLEGPDSSIFSITILVFV